MMGFIENDLYLIEDGNERIFGYYRGRHPTLGMHCFSTRSELLLYSHERLGRLNVRHQWEPQRKN